MLKLQNNIRSPRLRSWTQLSFGCGGNRDLMVVVRDVRLAWIVPWNHGNAGTGRTKQIRDKDREAVRSSWGAEIWGRARLRVCVWDQQASAEQCVCVCASSCSLLYASSGVFADSLPGSCVRDGIKHLSELCTWLHQPRKKSLPEQMENAGKRGPFGSNGWFWIWETKHVVPNFCPPRLSAMKLIRWRASVLLWHWRLWHWRPRLAAAHTVAMVAIWIFTSSSEKQRKQRWGSRLHNFNVTPSLKDNVLPQFFDWTAPSPHRQLPGWRKKVPSTEKSEALKAEQFFCCIL